MLSASFRRMLRRKRNTPPPLKISARWWENPPRSASFETPADPQTNPAMWLAPRPRASPNCPRWKQFSRRPPAKTSLVTRISASRCAPPCDPPACFGWNCSARSRSCAGRWNSPCGAKTPHPPKNPPTARMPSPSPANNSRPSSTPHARPAKSSPPTRFSPQEKNPSAPASRTGAEASCVRFSTFGSKPPSIASPPQNTRKPGCTSPVGSCVPVVE